LTDEGCGCEKCATITKRKQSTKGMTNRYKESQVTEERRLSRYKRRDEQGFKISEDLFGASKGEEREVKGDEPSVI